jgi:hypothetical protein
LDFSDGLIELRVIIPHENLVVNIYHKNDVTAEKDTVIDGQRLESKRHELVDQKGVSYPSRLLLTIYVLEKL